MLLIKGEVRRSAIEGMGFFTCVDIPKGHKVWEYNPLFDLAITEAALKELPAHVRQWVQRYGYPHPNRPPATWLVEIDDGRFINHAETPNLEDHGSTMVAARDIRAGEELTADYRAFASVEHLQEYHAFQFASEAA